MAMRLLVRISRAFFAATLVALSLAGCATNRVATLPMPPTVAEIVQMSRDKVPAADIVQRMRETRGVYRLPASELAKLRDQGVADAVIDYMQHTQIEAAKAEVPRVIYHGYYGYPFGYPYPYSGYWNYRYGPGWW
jgi:hypothetical protein